MQQAQPRASAQFAKPAKNINRRPQTVYRVALDQSNMRIEDVAAFMDASVDYLRDRLDGHEEFTGDALHDFSMALALTPDQLFEGHDGPAPAPAIEACLEYLTMDEANRPRTRAVKDFLKTEARKARALGEHLVMADAKEHSWWHGQTQWDVLRNALRFRANGGRHLPAGKGVAGIMLHETTIPVADVIEEFDAALDQYNQFLTDRKNIRFSEQNQAHKMTVERSRDIFDCIEAIVQSTKLAGEISKAYAKMVHAHPNVHERARILNNDPASIHPALTPERIRLACMFDGQKVLMGQAVLNRMAEKYEQFWTACTQEKQARACYDAATLNLVVYQDWRYSPQCADFLLAEANNCHLRGYTKGQDDNVSARIRQADQNGALPDFMQKIRIPVRTHVPHI